MSITIPQFLPNCALSTPESEGPHKLVHSFDLIKVTNGTFSFSDGDGG